MAIPRSFGAYAFFNNLAASMAPYVNSPASPGRCSPRFARLRAACPLLIRHAPTAVDR